jgi:hypothetical protein
MSMITLPSLAVRRRPGRALDAIGASVHGTPTAAWLRSELEEEDEDLYGDDDEMSELDGDEEELDVDVDELDDDDDDGFDSEDEL